MEYQHDQERGSVTAVCRHARRDADALGGSSLGAHDRRGHRPEALARDKEALLEFVNREVSGVYHPTGTCRMGLPDDPDAVVDPDGRVIGVEGLRVVDASIMPTIPRGNTNIPTIMVAEKLSDHLASRAGFGLIT